MNLKIYINLTYLTQTPFAIGRHLYHGCTVYIVEPCLNKSIAQLQDNLNRYLTAKLKLKITQVLLASNLVATH